MVPNSGTGASRRRTAAHTIVHELLPRGPVYERAASKDATAHSRTQIGILGSVKAHGSLNIHF